MSATLNLQIKSGIEMGLPNRKRRESVPCIGIMKLKHPKQKTFYST